MELVFNFAFFFMFVAGAASFSLQNIVQDAYQVQIPETGRLSQTFQQSIAKLGQASRIVRKMEQTSEKPWFCHGIGCPAFKELNKTKDYEVREYAASKWVTTSLQNISYDEGVSTMFRKLFDYIDGENVKKEKVAMTAPVIVKTIAGQGPACKSTFILSFFIDPAVKEAPPTPSSKDIDFSSLPKQKVYVKSFGGRAYEMDWIKEAESLAESLVRDQKKFVKDYFYTAGYDSPFRLLNRHNEVWFIAQE